MSSPYVTLGNRPLDQWKVTELKEELKRRKLTIKGLKEDLIKRLDEAVRSDLESAKESTDNNLNEENQSELPSEQATEGYIVSGRSKDLADTGDNLIGRPNNSPEIGIDHDSGLVSEGKDLEVNLGQEVNTVEVVGEQVSQFTTVETAVVLSETIEPAESLTGSVSHNLGQDKEVDLTRGVNHDGVESRHEDVIPEFSDPYIHMPLIDESSTTMVPPGGVSVKGSEVQNEATVSLDPPEIDTPEGPRPDHKVQQLKYQVSEVENPHLGSEVITDTVSTESVSIIEKNELKLDVVNDSVLELDVDCEIPPPPSTFTPDDGETHPMDVEEPPLDKKVENKEIHGHNYETVDSPKNIDGDELGPEKLSLDRSSGDDSMEEDVLEIKQMECKSVSDQTRDLVEKSELPIVEEDNIVDVVGGDKTIEAIVDDAENKEVTGLTSMKRKFDGDDNEAVGNNDTGKRPHRWKVGGLRGSEQERRNSETLKTPKGSSQDSQTSIKRFNISDSTNNEAPKERLVPPSPKALSNSLRIDRFLRPFTLKAVQELLGKTGTVTSFWMDHIKTHCYVSYSSIEEAVDTRNAVYNLQWPPNGGRMLVAEFVDPQEVKTHVEAPPASSTTPSSSGPSTFSTSEPPLQPQPSPRQQVPTLQLPPLSLPPPPPLANAAAVRERQHPSRVPLPREQLHLHPARDHPNLPPPVLPEKTDPPIVTLDDLFRKTISTPRIYYLPLSDEQVAAKLNSQGKNV
ncbi:uncharacterized protein LOC142523431 isoform X1 [Primulina tabacum]|uniref:uncharacterized protein LOC142523431 isoform X1 n=1 Tax=Primulina tabacum TaxID=48773 RepID=UPI003F599787